MHDLVVAKGLVVDGTGSAPAVADIAIDAGRVSEIAPPGSIDQGRTHVDAEGRVVTPGFIDPHTHLDAQLWWDATGAPSLFHGVTSVVLGSCGFGVAPCPPESQEYVLRSLEAVEEIPYRSTRSAVPFSWSTWPEFFQQVGNLDLGCNVGGLLPHSTLRLSVMGDHATTRAANPDEVARMAALLDEALNAGALGFSSSRGGNHTDASGSPMASRWADDNEMRALVARCRDRIWQINIASKGASDASGAQAAVDEVEKYLDWSRQSGARFTWTPLVVAATDRGAWSRMLEHNRHVAADYPVAAQVTPQPIVSCIAFDGPSFANMVDGWSKPFAGYGSLSDGERRERLRDPEFQRLLAAAPVDCNRVTGICFERWKVTISPNHPDRVGCSLGELGDTLGRHPADVLVEMALLDDLKTVVAVPLSNLDHEANSTLAVDPSTLLGLGDAGAHVRAITNYTYPTFVLATLVRDERRMTLEQAVHKLSSHPAGMLGLRSRGELRVGMAADVNVIDLNRLSLTTPELVADLPQGSQRMTCLAEGYDRVIVNGEVVVQGDRLLDARPGRLLVG